MTDLLARLLLALLRPVGLALARWRLTSLDRAQRRLVARLLTRRRYSRLLEIYAVTPQQQIANYVQKTLAGGPYTNVSTVFTLSDVAGLPTVGNFTMVIKDAAPATTFEIVEIASVNVGAAQVTTSTNGPSVNGRGMEGTTAIAHVAGAIVGNDITAAMLLRAFPWGILPNGVAKVIANQGTFTVQTDIIGLTVTVTIGTTRQIRLLCQIAGGSTVATDLIGAFIMEGATILQTAQWGAAPATAALTQYVMVTLTPTAGVHTYKIAMARQGGSGVMTMNAASTQPAILTAEDIGPA